MGSARLTDEQLDELIPATWVTNREFLMWCECQAKISDAAPSLIAELRALRTVAEKAKALCLRFQDHAAARRAKDDGLIIMAEDKRNGAYIDLCFALDRAGVKP